MERDRLCVDEGGASFRPLDSARVEASVSERIKRVVDPYDPNSLAGKARARRFAFFRGLLDQVPKPCRVLDVGGAPPTWREIPDGVEVTLLNTTPVDEGPEMPTLVADACDMPFEAGEYDVIFSNSVIEHVGDQEAMAEEIRRVGQRYFVQTPNYYFPIEPHALFPAFQYLPLEMRATLLTRFELGHPGRISDRDEARRWASEIRLLKAKDMRRLFPDAQLHRERFLGLTKSLMVYRWT